nr:unnamed protein product [Callosobruchus chinensis]
MKHGIKKNKLSRCTEHRSSMLKNLSISLINHEQIVTTLPKAKALRPYVEKFITIAKNNDSLHGRRLLLSRLHNSKLVVDKLLSVLANRYQDRKGGYSRIIKFGTRKGDCAPMAVIELVDRDISAKGYFGELLVSIYLKLKFYNVIKRRFRCKLGEIDLIVSKKKELIFIEVKTSLFGKEVPISHFQCQSIINSSKYFLSKNLDFLDYSVRYDLCFLSLRRRPIYIKNAWIEEW